MTHSFPTRRASEFQFLHAVLGWDFYGIETCTNLRTARNWARLTATGERYMKASSILETIGDTPHIRMNRLFGSAEVWIKSERSNPAGSIKDRIALSDRKSTRLNSSH